MDVYADWVDACDEAAKEAVNDGDDSGAAFREPAAATRKVPSTNTQGGDGGGGDEEMDGFIENDMDDYGDED